MTYAVTQTQQAAQDISDTYLRVWAFSLEDQGYGRNMPGNPSTGLKAGVQVPFETTAWDTPKLTADNRWAVLVPDASQMFEWNTVVVRPYSSLTLVLPAPPAWQATRGLLVAQGLVTPGALASSPQSLTVVQWCSAIVEGRGQPVDFLEDDGTLFPVDEV